MVRTVLCAMSGDDHLYVIQQDVTGAVKIGRSRDVNARLNQLQTGSPYKLRIILVLENKGHLEQHMHRRLRDYRIRRDKGEWFSYESLPELPDWIYEQLDLDTANTWWNLGS